VRGMVEGGRGGEDERGQCEGGRRQGKWEGKGKDKGGWEQ